MDRQTSDTAQEASFFQDPDPAPSPDPAPAAARSSELDLAPGGPRSSSQAQSGRPRDGLTATFTCVSRLGPGWSPSAPVQPPAQAQSCESRARDPGSRTRPAGGCAGSGATNYRSSAARFPPRPSRRSAHLLASPPIRGSFGRRPRPLPPPARASFGSGAQTKRRKRSYFPQKVRPRAFPAPEAPPTTYLSSNLRLFRTPTPPSMPPSFARESFGSDAQAEGIECGARRPGPSA